jgi:hypothetical protein
MASVRRNPVEACVQPRIDVASSPLAWIGLCCNGSPKQGVFVLEVTRFLLAQEARAPNTSVES